MNYVFAIDPGDQESAYVYLSIAQPMHILQQGKVPNGELLDIIEDLQVQPNTYFAVEQIQSYGMSVGNEVFNTAMWAGRYLQAWLVLHGGNCVCVPRKEVKLCLLGKSAVRNADSQVRQSLIGIYGPPGTKKAPNRVTYGIYKDAWAALGVATTVWIAKQGQPQRKYFLREIAGMQTLISKKIPKPRVRKQKQSFVA